MKKTILLIIFTLVSNIAMANNSTSSLVHQYQLPNGLKIIVKEDHRAPTASLQVWYKVGSGYEPTGITGISHVLEHMMFEGSQNFPNDSYSKIIAANGGQENAQTDYDYTFYYQLVAANKLPIGFQLEADRMQHLMFNPQVFAKEMQVVKEERRMRTDNNPQGSTYERFNAAAFISSPYHHAPIGWMNDLNNMTLSDVKNWYDQWYAPNNAILVVVGDVNPNDVYKLAEQYFGPIPAKKLPQLKPQLDQPELGLRTVVVKAPAQLPWLVMGYNVPTLPNAQKKWQPYALAVIAGILDGGDSARLEANIVRGKQLATDVDADYSIYSRLPNLFVLDGTPSTGHTIKELQKAFLDEIKQLQTIPVTEQELQRVKNQVIAQNIYAKDSINDQATDIGALESVGLPWQETDNFVKQIEQITPAQVQAAAKEFFTSKRLTVARLSPLPINGKPVDESSPVGGSNVR